MIKKRVPLAAFYCLFLYLIKKTLVCVQRIHNFSFIVYVQCILVALCYCLKHRELSSVQLESMPLKTPDESLIYTLLISNEDNSTTDWIF